MKTTSYITSITQGVLLACMLVFCTSCVDPYTRCQRAEHPARCHRKVKKHERQQRRKIVRAIKHDNRRYNN